MMESSDKTFQEDIARAGLPVLVVFHAGWSRPCRGLSAWLQEVRGRIGPVRVVSLNTDTNPVTATAYHVNRVPTVAVLTRDGVAWRSDGPPDPDSVVSAWLEATKSLETTAP
jgi:thioredoxin 1